MSEIMLQVLPIQEGGGTHSFFCTTFRLQAGAETLEIQLNNWGQAMCQAIAPHGDPNPLLSTSWKYLVRVQIEESQVLSLLQR